MSAPKKITAKHIQKLTTDYEAWLNAARETFGRMQDEPSARALDAYVLLMHGDLHRLWQKIDAKEQEA